MIIAAILILFLVSFAVLGINQLALRPGYSWFLAIGGCLFAWILVIFSYSAEPYMILLMDWQQSILFSVSPQLIVDSSSWPFAVAITTLVTSVLLTDIARFNEIDPNSWAANLALTGIGLLAVLAANPLTLLMGWTFIDVVETYIRFIHAEGSSENERVVISFSVRIIGSTLIIAAILRAQAMGRILEFTNIPIEVSGYLILATGLRLGVLPPQPPFMLEKPIRRGLGTMIRLIPVSASLVLLTRVASVGVASNWEISLLIISSLAVIYGGLTWFGSKDELDGRPFWILGMSAFSVLASILTQSFTSIIWGLSMVFSGGFLFLFSTRVKRFSWLPILGIVGISAFPFTPLWHGLSIFINLNIVFIIIFLLGFIFLVLGYLRYMVRFSDNWDDVEGWVWIVYPIGLMVLTLTHFWVIWSLGGISVPNGGFYAANWWIGVIIFGLVTIFWVAKQRNLIKWSIKIPQIFREFHPLNWLYLYFWWGYRSISKLVLYFAHLLEGAGGVLWAVMIIILLISFFLQPLVAG
jgi:hypothetical protein